MPKKLGTGTTVQAATGIYRIQNGVFIDASQAQDFQTPCQEAVGTTKSQRKVYRDDEGRGPEGGTGTVGSETVRDSP